MPETIPTIIKKLRKLGTILDGQQEKIKKDITQERSHICFLESNLRRLQSANEKLRRARHDAITLRHGSSICSKSRSMSRKSRTTFLRSPSALKSKLINNDLMPEKLKERNVIEVTNFNTFRGRLTTGPMSSRGVNADEKENRRMSAQVACAVKNKLKERKTVTRKSYHCNGYSRINSR